jgi:hypothetical protein
MNDDFYGDFIETAAKRLAAGAVIVFAVGVTVGLAIAWWLL